MRGQPQQLYLGGPPPTDWHSWSPIPRLLLHASQSQAFTPGPIILSRAPGRLDVLGGIADYSGCRVCEMSLALATAVLIQPRNDNRLIIITAPHPSSQPSSPPSSLSRIDLPFSILDTIDPLQIRRSIPPQHPWAKYPVGCAWWAWRNRNPSSPLPPDTGLTLLIDSDIPWGSGISSSAALEIAVLAACSKLWQITISPLALAAAGQYVENHVIPAPCGIMDQITSCLGQENALLEILCQPTSDHQPAQLLGHIPIPPGYAFAGIHSGVSHQVSADPYTLARTASFIGEKILSTFQINPPPDGFLARIDPTQYRQTWQSQLPPQLTGQAFLQRYGQTHDSITKVLPSVTYNVRSATDHHIFEMQRSTLFVQLLKQASDPATSPSQQQQLLALAGQQMYDSHQSYSKNVNLGHPATDHLLHLIQSLGLDHGFYGARITGGGCGGTVAILLKDQPQTYLQLKKLAQQYQLDTQRTPTLFIGTGPGAAAWGTLSQNWHSIAPPNPTTTSP